MLVAGWTMLGVPAHATYGARAAVDEPQYLLTAISLGQDGDLDIADELADEAYRPFHRVDLPRQSAPAQDAGLGGAQELPPELSPHEPLLPALLALPMRLGGWVAAKATIAVFAGLLAAATAWTATRRFGVPLPVAVGVVGAFSLAAPLATFATQVYPELPAALAVVVAVAAVTGPPTWRSAIVLAVALLALPWLAVKYAAVALALALAAVAAWRWRRPWTISLGAAASAIGAAAFLAFHQRVYGGWTAYAASGYAAANGELAVTGQQRDLAGRSGRLVGLLVDDPFGLALWMPAWLLAPFAVGVLWRRRPPGSEALVIPLAAGWLVATFVAVTMHGWWWPGRQLVVVLPLAVIAVAAAAAESSGVRRLLVPAALLGIGTWMWTTVEAITRRHVLVVDFDRTGNPWVQLWRLALPDGRRGATVDSLLLAAWTVVVAGLVWLGWRRPRLRLGAPPPRPPALEGGDHVCLVLPARDEGGRVGGVVRRIPSTVCGLPTRCLVVDDGSADDTASEAAAAGADVIRLGTHRGLGAAVRTGLAVAVERGAMVVAFCDADGEYAPEQLPSLVGPILDGSADYVVGSRFSGTIESMRPHRRVGNVVLTSALGWITRLPITDGQSGYRALSRRAAAEAAIAHDYNYAQVLTIDVVAKGFVYAEVPIRYRVRSSGRSYVRLPSYLRHVVPTVARQLTR